MGYDMTTVIKDEGEKERVEVARSKFNDACTARKAFEHGTAEYAAAQKAVDAAYEAWSAQEHSYFRLNVWGMGEARAAMCRLRMVLDVGHAEFPTHEQYGVTDEMSQYDAEYNELPREDLAPQLRALLEHCDRVTDSQAESPIGIPIYKLGSNDGWLVTPDEIAAALTQYDRATLDDLDAVPDGDWWPKWIEYLRYAMKHGGFRVN